MSGQFQQTIDAFYSDMQGRRVAVHEMSVILNNRGFGALLLLPCIIELLPTGSIPGVPSMCAIIIILLAMQVLMGRRHPWVPDRIKNMTFNHEKIENGLDKAQPYIKWLDRQARPRWTFMASHKAEQVAALMIIALACTFFPLELVPFASSIPSFTIAMFAIGFLTKDGLLLLMAWMMSVVASIGISYIVLNFIL